MCGISLWSHPLTALVHGIFFFKVILNFKTFFFLIILMVTFHLSPSPCSIPGIPEEAHSSAQTKQTLG